MVENASASGGEIVGGYKQSGNGREWGKFGLEEYLEVEVKAIAGFSAA